MQKNAVRRAFTLVELLVVIAIIGVLVALLLPAVQMAREAGRRASCSNNLHNIVIAMHNYHDTLKSLPPGGCYPNGAVGDSWSVQARLLPFLEQANLQNLANLSLTYIDPVNLPVTKTRVAMYICPSEVRDEARPDGAVTHYPLTYGYNYGTWFVYDPSTRQSGDGVAAVNNQFTLGSVTDGTSNTIGFAEVKAWTAYNRDGGNPGGVNQPIPGTPAQVSGYGGSFKADSGHTEWVDARVHQTGFTAVFAPNTKVPFTSGGKLYDIDFNSSREGKTTNGVCYAAVTSRSYHPGIVQVALMDGSVRAVSSNVDLLTWRSMATRSGNEAFEMP